MILDCFTNTTASVVVNGLDWVGGNHRVPAVANMSVGCPTLTVPECPSDWSTVRQAVQRLVASGVTVVVSAGNTGIDACEHIASDVPEAIAVGASDRSDQRADFSNWGSCVDLFAPGKGIASLDITDGSGGGGDLREVQEAVNEKDGTSFAAPFVAGIAALYLHFDWTASPASVTSHILSQATEGRLTNLKGSPNRLLYSRMAVPSCHCPPGVFCSCTPF